VYGDDEIRTGCVGCNLVSQDTALERLLTKHPDKWGHLRPLIELKPLFQEIRQPKYRLRKTTEYRQDGTPAKNAQRLGPLTMEAREYGLNVVLNIQWRINEAANGRPGIDLINAEEEARIRELWALNTWPNGWEGDEIVGDVPIDAVRVGRDGSVAVQPLLV
jgi:DNA sulfur modification protein DndC